MRNLLFLFSILCSGYLFAQKDSLELGDKYWEDQLYFGISYNQLFNQPSNVIGSGFSYGLDVGYIKDISMVKSGRIALGVGIGYSYNSLKHGFNVFKQNNETVLEVDSSITTTNALKLQSLEFPIEFRWRTSTANKYNFWRIYSGLKVTYNLKNTIYFDSNGIESVYTNIKRFNKLQYGVTISAGYSKFNFHLYYGITPLFKESAIGSKTINTRLMKLGLIFYIL